MKRMAFAVLALVAMLTLAGSAAAAPSGKGLETFEVTCDGQEVTVTVSAGQSFWLGGQHYLIKAFTGTFTPEAGEPETFTQTYGEKKGLGDATITCTATFVEPGEGSFTILVTAVAVPPR